MSYAAAAALQVAIFAQLSAAPALTGVPVLDAMPGQGGPASFVLIGPEEVLDRSDKSGAGAEHRFQISVISADTGFLAAKTLATEICESLEASLPALSVGRLVHLRFVKAKAQRLRDGGVRRIDLTFGARIEI